MGHRLVLDQSVCDSKVFFAQMSFSFLRPPTILRFPQIFKQLEKDVETVIDVLQPGPLGIIVHKFSAVEVQEAEATVKRAVANWRRNAALEGLGRVGIAQENEGSPR